MSIELGERLKYGDLSMDYLYDVAYPAYNDLEATDRIGMMVNFNIMCGNTDYHCATAAQNYLMITHGIVPSDQGKSYFSHRTQHITLVIRLFFLN